MTKRSSKNPAPPATSNPKEEAFYSAVLQAWIDTRMERDRTLLALAAGGIGLLVTLLALIPASTALLRTLFSLATLAFAATLLCGIIIFQKNAKYLEMLAKEADTSSIRLHRWDVALLVSFAIGVGGSLGIGATLLFSEPPPRGVDSMPTKKDSTGGKPQRIDESRSLDGLTNLKPSKDTGGQSQTQKTDTSTTKKP